MERWNTHFFRLYVFLRDFCYLSSGYTVTTRQASLYSFGSWNFWTNGQHHGYWSCKKGLNMRYYHLLNCLYCICSYFHLSLSFWCTLIVTEYKETKLIAAFFRWKENKSHFRKLWQNLSYQTLLIPAVSINTVHCTKNLKNFEVIVFWSYLCCGKLFWYIITITVQSNLVYCNGCELNSSE